jgi:hypothetical protein
LELTANIVTAKNAKSGVTMSLFFIIKKLKSFLKQKLALAQAISLVTPGLYRLKSGVINLSNS